MVVRVQQAESVVDEEHLTATLSARFAADESEALGCLEKVSALMVNKVICVLKCLFAAREQRLQLVLGERKGRGGDYGDEHCASCTR